MVDPPFTTSRRLCSLSCKLVINETEHLVGGGSLTHTHTHRHTRLTIQEKRKCILAFCEDQDELDHFQVLSIVHPTLLRHTLRCTTSVPSPHAPGREQDAGRDSRSWRLHPPSDASVKDNAQDVMIHVPSQSYSCPQDFHWCVLSYNLVPIVLKSECSTRQ